MGSPEKMSERKSPADDRALEDAQKEVEARRANMAVTLKTLEHRLSPGDLRDKALVELRHVEGKVKEAVIEQFREVKLGLKHELSEAKAGVKEDLQTAFRDAKQSMRDATLGRVEDMATKAGDAMTTTRDSLFQTVRENPLPAALAGVGIAWLLMNRSQAAAGRRRPRRRAGEDGGYRFDRSSGAHGYDPREAPDPASDSWTDRATQGARDAAGGLVEHVGSAVRSAEQGVEDYVHQAKERGGAAIHAASAATGHAAERAVQAAGRAMHSVSDAAGHFATDTGHVAAQFADEGRTGARKVEHVIEETMHERPLVLGAVAMAAGLAVGLSLPRTHREDELMGASRDDLLHKAGDVTGDAAHAVERMTAKVAEGAKGAIQGAVKT